MFKVGKKIETTFLERKDGTIQINNKMSNGWRKNTDGRKQKIVSLEYEDLL